MLARPFILAAVVLAVSAFAPSTVVPAKAQGPLLDQYVAFIGPADHFNSRGQRLTQPWQILRQDRANYHRFGIRDAGDQYDGYFGSAENRARMERMIRNGYINANAARRVVNGNVWVRVEIYRNAVNVTVE